MFQSDVFSLSLVIYQIFCGELADWPVNWPAPGYSRIRGKLRPKTFAWLRKGMEFKPHDRFRSAVTMQKAFEKIHANAVQRA